MQNIKHFTPYKPESPAFPGAAYLKSEDGQDWYECQKQFADDTLKFTYDDNGVITCITRDVSGLWPYHLSVAEVPDTDENRRVDISGRWGFDGTNITDLMTTDKARERKSREIDAWRDAQENSGIIFDWNGRRWDGGKASKDRLTPVLTVANAGLLPDSFFWTDADNNDVPVTAEDLAALDAAMTQAMVIQGVKIHERQRQMKKDIGELTKVSDILNYSVGWPEGG
ncbi:DUF4376 domain-containing protein [Salmonella enterica]|nr:DUF4376 domain-containing protein [Salmonella enterica]EDX5652341.1 DUF4376 domain-containing protein [Salmonella enterica subsp. enterica serovar Kisarawe]EHN2042215.1 DUF4376 domain-containing protein [Salmonella enterica subsp. enterica serovar Nima]EAY4506064.1 DUF4376 domain-containing protein [Salmonella enterica]EBG9191337.1 DUF4376 domain-containing protein [Salmonella enterica]